MTDDTIRIVGVSGGAATIDELTTAKFRDPLAWYHVVVSVDTSQATAANRLFIYVNGVAQTYAGTAPVLNADLLGNWTTRNIGRSPLVTNYFDGHMAELYFIEGQQVGVSSFGQTDPVTGVWGAKKYVGTYGTNGFYLDFSDTTTTTTLCNDKSGRGNHWTPNNISLTAGSTYDSMLDVPLGGGGSQRGNYCTLNPISTSISGYVKTANMSLSGNALTEYPGVGSTMYVSSGKWYWESTATTGGTLNCTFGFSPSFAFGGTFQTGAGSVGYTNDTGAITVGGSTVSTGAVYGAGDIIAVALDMNAGTAQFYKNNVATGSQVTSLSGLYTPAMNINYYPTNALYINFGQQPFTYTPPAGFLSLHTGNLSVPTIRKPNQHFDASIWTGTSATNTITNSGSMQPDLVWIKGRATAYNHVIQDSVRGVGVSGKKLSSNLTDSEGSTNFATNYGYVNALLANGFSLDKTGTASNDWASVNLSGQTYVGWQWKAGGVAVSNTNGSITSQVSANPTAGFSIVSYTGTSTQETIGHGLGSIPKLIIVKPRPSVTDWPVYTSSLGISQYLILDTITSAGSIANYWGAATPTSTVFGVPSGGAYNTNLTGQATVAYCFAEISGYSKIGTYTGNGANDGAFVYCGFRPRYLMIKATNANERWLVWDTTRDTYNGIGLNLNPNSSTTEGDATSNVIDILSNGFKIKSTASSAFNFNGYTYIFYAIAEAPFKYALAR
jgi:hypothetical protein